MRYGVTPRLELGLGYQWRTQMARPLVNYKLIPEHPKRPSLTLGQMSDVTGGRQKVYLNAGKSLQREIGLPVNVYLGVARSYSESRWQAIGGVNIALTRQLSASTQFDGHHFVFGLTASVGSINGAAIKIGVVAVRAEYVGPMLAVNLPLGR